MPLPMPLPMPRIPRELLDAIGDQCRWFSSDYLVVQESPRESLFKDRYFVSGIGSGIAKRFKDSALINFTCHYFTIATLEIFVLSTTATKLDPPPPADTPPLFSFIFSKVFLVSLTCWKLEPYGGYPSLQWDCHAEHFLK